MERIVSYLEKLGYTVEEQGKIEKFLVVFKAGQPIGFILQDLTVKLVSGSDTTNNIQAVIDYLIENQGLDNVGAKELLLCSYRGSQLTTYFDTDEMKPCYVCYVRNSDTGEVKSSIYQEEDTAAYMFISQTKMLDLRKFTAQQETFGDRVRNRLINYLLAKNKENAGQR